MLVLGPGLYMVRMRLGDRGTGIDIKRHREDGPDSLVMTTTVSNRRNGHQLECERQDGIAIGLSFLHPQVIQGALYTIIDEIGFD